MKKNKMEEIQARRGFFRSASKGAMPVMTMLDVTTSANLFGGAVNVECKCSGSCYNICNHSCNYTCQGEAKPPTP